MKIYHLLSPFDPVYLPDGTTIYLTEALVKEGETFGKMPLQVREQELADKIEKHFRNNVQPLTYEDVKKMSNVQQEETVRYN